jgi:CRISPR-associated protein Cas2
LVGNQGVLTVPVLVWIIYDIVDDKIRSKVAKICKQYGLQRVQYSVFLGKLEMNRFDEIAEVILDLIDEEVDRVYVFPFSQNNFRKIKVLGQGFDKKYVNEEVLEKFF